MEKPKYPDHFEEGLRHGVRVGSYDFNSGRIGAPVSHRQ